MVLNQLKKLHDEPTKEEQKPEEVEIRESQLPMAVKHSEPSVE